MTEAITNPPAEVHLEQSTDSFIDGMIGALRVGTDNSRDRFEVWKEMRQELMKLGVLARSFGASEQTLYSFDGPINACHVEMKRELEKIEQARDFLIRMRGDKR